MSAFNVLQLALLALASLASAQQSPCAQVSERLGTSRSASVPATLALQCLRSVPLQTEGALTQLRGLRLWLGFQSDLAYLHSSQPARLYPDVDLLAGLDTLQDRIGQDYYSNEYDFQADVARLIGSAYDGHLSYIPDIVGTFAFLRAQSGGRFALMSISSDGVELPEVYAYQDRFVLAATDARASFVPSPVVRINDQDVEEFLNHQATLAGSYQDPDANYNLLFPNELALDRGTVFEEFRFFNESDETTLSFENGTDTTIVVGAVSRIDLTGVTDGESFFARCCNGTIEDLFSEGMSGQPTAGATGMLEAHRANVRHARPLLRYPELEKRQADSERPQFPTAVISEGTAVVGYFPDTNPDLAVLAISTFEVALDRVSNFQSAIRDFLAAAAEAGKTRLIIDLRGNPGGLGFLAHDTFRQIFPTAFPYDAVNFRAVPLLDFTGRVVSQAFSNASAADYDNALSAPPLFSGAYPFNYRQQLDENNSTFESWSDLFGPSDGQSVEDNFTSLVRPNLTNILQTQFPVYPLGRTAEEASRPQAFDPENIVLLQDGGCSSTCALFSEFMKSNAPGDQNVRQVMVGGRRQTGPAQGVGGIKGGQLGLLIALGQAVLTAVSSASVAQLFDFQSDLNQEDIAAAIAALDRATTSSSDSDLLPGGLPAASVNFRNAIRQGDDSTTPLQYVYDAADCRIFYTASMYTSQELLWQKAYQVIWEDGQCVADARDHPSARAVTDYGDIEIPDNARSNSGIQISGQETSGGSSTDGDGSESGSGDDSQGAGDEEGRASLASTPFVTMFLGLATVAFGQCML